MYRERWCIPSWFLFNSCLDVPAKPISQTADASPSTAQHQAIITLDGVQLRPRSSTPDPLLFPKPRIRLAGPLNNIKPAKRFNRKRMKKYFTVGGSQTENKIHIYLNKRQSFKKLESIKHTLSNGIDFTSIMNPQVQVLKSQPHLKRNKIPTWFDWKDIF